MAKKKQPSSNHSHRSTGPTGPLVDADISPTYSPANDDGGRIDGVVLTASETTAKVPSERERERLAADLEGMRRLYLNLRLVGEADLDAALDAILASAIEFAGTDRGTVQLLREASGNLEIVVHRGYGHSARFIEHFRRSGFEQGCDAAKKQRTRLVIEDTRTFPGLVGTTEGEVALGDGILAAQSTPMVTRGGKMVGVLSTQYRQPHRPGEHELRLIDLLACIAADFVERHRADAALRESEERFRLLVENAREHAVFTLGPDGRVTTWNPGAARIFGYRAEEIVGRDAAELFTPEDRAAGEHQKELAAAAAGGRASDDRWQVRKGGERFWANGVTTAIRDAAGTLLGFAKVCRDLTEWKRAEERMRSANEELERRVAARTAELVAYQRRLRSLVAELGRTEVRERRRLATELHDNLVQLLAVCKMRVSAIRAAARDDARVTAEAEVVRDFLGDGIAYMRTLMADLRPDVLDGHDLAAAVRWVAGRMGRHGLTVTVEGDGEPTPLDDDTLGLVFESVRELLFNVVKHAGTREATVTSARHDGTVRVTVSDTGRGYDPARAVEPAEDGGFGLFSIRERLDLVGGSVEIDSRVGGGTRVTLVAPLRVGGPADAGHRAGDGAADDADGTEPRPTPEGRLRVLLVDDHRVVREGLRSLFQSQPDMEVVGEAADGAAGAELARALRPDVVVMDVNMPKLNGVEATRQVVAGVPGVRVIGLSVRDDKEVAAAMRDAGAVAHLPKDGEPDALFAAVREAGVAR